MIRYLSEVFAEYSTSLHKVHASRGTLSLIYTNTHRHYTHEIHDIRLSLEITVRGDGIIIRISWYRVRSRKSVMLVAQLLHLDMFQATAIRILEVLQSPGLRYNRIVKPDCGKHACEKLRETLKVSSAIAGDATEFIIVARH